MRGGESTCDCSTSNSGEYGVFGRWRRHSHLSDVSYVRQKPRQTTASAAARITEAMTEGLGIYDPTELMLRAGAAIAAEPYPCRLTTQELVDLLKMPTCCGQQPPRGPRSARQHPRPEVRQPGRVHPLRPRDGPRRRPHHAPAATRPPGTARTPARPTSGRCQAVKGCTRRVRAEVCP